MEDWLIWNQGTVTYGGFSEFFSKGFEGCGGLLIDCGYEVFKGIFQFIDNGYEVFKVDLNFI